MSDKMDAFAARNALETIKCDITDRMNKGEIPDDFLLRGVQFAHEVLTCLIPAFRGEEIRDKEAGLYGKYNVFDAADGRIVDGCFVLRPEKDKAAAYALMAYAEKTENKRLSKDLYGWLQEIGEERQKGE